MFGNIVIEVKDIALRGRVVVWDLACFFVLINGFVIMVSEYETPSIFITKFHVMKAL